jgi:protein-disulfide isomerase
VETEPQLIEQYVKSGKARLVYRHLLQLGAASKALAEASECAGAQGKFWEMRDKIYRQQDELFSATSFAAVQPLVAELGLDEGQFQQCMEQHQFEQQVEADNAAAQQEGVRSRPVMDINGTRIIGAQPFGAFQQVLAPLISR